MSYTYIPIFKTKTNVEKPLVESILYSFFIQNKMIPYLEITKDYDGDGDRYKTCPKMRVSLSNIKHFEEFMNIKKDEFPLFFESYSKIDENDPNIIPSIRVTKRILAANKDGISSFLNKRRKKGLASAIRVHDSISIDVINDALSILDENDWLIIDIGESDYDSIAYSVIPNLKKAKHENIAIFASERPLTLTGEFFSDQEYEPLMNTSLLEKVKNKCYPFKTFGSYAALKDSLSEGGGTAPCYGVFLLYNSEKNCFYSIKSEEKAHISTVYSGVREKVEELQKDKESELNKIVSHPLAMNALSKAIAKKTPRASDFYQVSAIQFITEVSKLLSS